jgi:hypothetical protein
MENHAKNNGRKGSKDVLVLRVLIVFALVSFSFYVSTEAYTIGPNYRNITVDTTANITNALPEILTIVMEDPVTLTAGFTKDVECNVTLRDYNGGDTIDTVNATFFHSSSTLESANDNNTHYTNLSCSQTAVSGFYSNYTCSAPFYYYAEPNSWNCTVFVNDTAYGELAILDTSPNMTANVTNFGNVPINVSVYGYGNVTGDGLAMDCEQGNISIDNERYSADITDTWATKAQLSGSATQIPTLTVSKQTVPAVPIINITYWQLYVPPNPFGVCNGTVVFQAESST